MRRRTHFHLWIFVLACLIVLFARPHKIFASPTSVSYSVQVLPGLGAYGSYGLALNNRGDVVGASANPNNDQENIHAFFWDGNSIQDINAAGWSFSWPVHINNRGAVVGWYDIPDPPYNGSFLWLDGGVQNIIPPAMATAINANSINDQGTIAGFYSFQAPGTGYRAFVWKDGVLSDLAAPPNSGTIATSINNSGEIVGDFGPVFGGPMCDAVAWVKGQFYDLGEFGGGCTDAIEINERAQILANNGDRAFVWQNGFPHELPPFSDGLHSTAYSINDSGDVVGVSSGGYDCPCYIRPVIWHNGEPSDLSGFIPAQFQPVNAVRLAINNRGQILITTGSKFNGTTFLLTPH